jgi:hypothetical protein
MTKSQQYFQDMMDYNKETFEVFKKVHDAYIKDPQHWQEKLNEEGEKTMLIIHRYEDMLCSSSETSGYGKFSANLSNTFWQMIRKQFPKIDCVGLK